VDPPSSDRAIDERRLAVNGFLSRTAVAVDRHGTQCMRSEPWFAKTER
jgi:hypothetical protein